MDLIIEALPSILIAVAIVFIILVMLGVKLVPQGMGYNVERFGRYVRTLKPGIRFFFPVIEVISAKVNMMEQVIDIPQQEVTTRDKAMLSVEGVISFQVIDASKTAYREKNMNNFLAKTIRNVVSSTNLDELLSKCDKTNSQLLAYMNDVATHLGVKIIYFKAKYIKSPHKLETKSYPIKADDQNIKKPQKAPTVRSSIKANKNPTEDLAPIKSHLIRDIRIYMAKENFTLSDFGRSPLYLKLKPYLDAELTSHMHMVKMGGRSSISSRDLKAAILDNLTRLDHS